MPKDSPSVRKGLMTSRPHHNMKLKVDGTLGDPISLSERCCYLGIGYFQEAEEGESVLCLPSRRW